MSISLYNPATDGVTHINAYSRGKTELGRLLSNFAHTPFDLPDLGHFESVEGLWYYLSVPDRPEREQLRRLHGYRAKQVGRKLKAELGEVRHDRFRDWIRRGIWTKIHVTPGLLQKLVGSDLPIIHYYVFGGGVRRAPEHDWVWEDVEVMRTALKERHPGLIAQPERAWYVHDRDRHAGDIRMGRSGMLGNPYALHKVCDRCGERHDDKGSTLRCYEAYLVDRLATDERFRSHAVEVWQGVHGSDLRYACFCGDGPEIPDHCHVSVFDRVVGDFINNPNDHE